MNWKTPITLLVLTGILLGAAYYGWTSLSAPSEKPDTPSATTASSAPPIAKEPKCTTVKKFGKGQSIAAEDVIVNVFNAGSIPGLASKTLDSLVDKGFERGAADNAPVDLAATNVTIVTEKRDSPVVRLVAMQFQGTVGFADGPDLAPGVDIVVGDNFLSVDSEARRVLRLKRPVTTCTSDKQTPDSTS